MRLPCSKDWVGIKDNLGMGQNLNENFASVFNKPNDMWDKDSLTPGNERASEAETDLKELFRWRAWPRLYPPP